MSTDTGNRIVIEWAAFTLAGGIDEATLLAASAALQRDFLDQQAGFVRRELVKIEGKRWADIVYWNSRAEAEQAMDRAAASPVCHKYFALMEGEDPNDPGAGVIHVEVVETYDAPVLLATG